MKSADSKKTMEDPKKLGFKKNPFNFSSQLSSLLGYNNTNKGEKCSICFEECHVKALLPCEHNSMCYLCVFRLAWLQKCNECPYCKLTFDTIYFTRDFSQNYQQIHSSANHNSMKLFEDCPKISIYSTSNIHLEKLAYLCGVHCWFPNCHYQDFPTIKDLQTHLKGAHYSALCDICIHGRDHSFLPEQFVYLPKDIPYHIKNGNKTTEPNIDPHIRCNHCTMILFSQEEYKIHNKTNHFVCSLCSANFGTYENLYSHFEKEHFVCDHPNCIALRFIVFRSHAELTVHQAMQHGESNISKKTVIHLASTPDVSNPSSKQRGARAQKNMKTGTNTDGNNGNNAEVDLIPSENISLSLNFLFEEDQVVEMERQTKWKARILSLVKDEMTQVQLYSPEFLLQLSKSFGIKSKEFFTPKDFTKIKELSMRLRDGFERVNSLPLQVVNENDISPTVYIQQVLDLYWRNSNRDHSGMEVEDVLADAADMCSRMIISLPISELRILLVNALDDEVKNSMMVLEIRKKEQESSMNKKMKQGQINLVHAHDTFPQIVNKIIRSCLKMSTQKVNVMQHLTTDVKTKLAKHIAGLSSYECSTCTPMTLFLSQFSVVNTNQMETLEAMRGNLISSRKQKDSFIAWARKMTQFINTFSIPQMVLVEEYILNATKQVEIAKKNEAFPTLSSTAQPLISSSSMPSSSLPTSSLALGAPGLQKKSPNPRVENESRSYVKMNTGKENFPALASKQPLNGKTLSHEDISPSELPLVAKYLVDSKRDYYKTSAVPEDFFSLNITNKSKKKADDKMNEHETDAFPSLPFNPPPVQHFKIPAKKQSNLSNYNYAAVVEHKQKKDKPKSLLPPGYKSSLDSSFVMHPVAQIPSALLPTGEGIKQKQKTKKNTNKATVNVNEYQSLSPLSNDLISETPSTNEAFIPSSVIVPELLTTSPSKKEIINSTSMLNNEFPGFPVIPKSFKQSDVMNVQDKKSQITSKNDVYNVTVTSKVEKSYDMTGLHSSIGDDQRVYSINEIFENVKAGSGENIELSNIGTEKFPSLQTRSRKNDSDKVVISEVAKKYLEKVKMEETGVLSRATSLDDITYSVDASFLFNKKKQKDEKKRK